MPKPNVRKRAVVWIGFGVTVLALIAITVWKLTENPYLAHTHTVPNIPGEGPLRYWLPADDLFCMDHYGLAWRVSTRTGIRTPITIDPGEARSQRTSIPRYILGASDCAGASPDGRWILVSENQRIWLLPTDGGSAQQYTGSPDECGNEHALFWNTDGTRIVEVCGTNPLDLVFRATADPGNVQAHTKTPWTAGAGMGYVAGFTSKGRVLHAEVGGGGGETLGWALLRQFNSDAHSIGSEERMPQERKIPLPANTNNIAFYPSPKAEKVALLLQRERTNNLTSQLGDLIAALTHRRSDYYEHEVWIVDVDGRNFRRICDIPGAFPVGWTVDGTRFGVIDQANTLYMIPVD